MSPSQFDASSEPVKRHDGSRGESSSPHPKPFLGIRFSCCRTYARIYRNQAGTAYSGRCPVCRAEISVPIGEGGTSSRFFNAS